MSGLVDGSTTPWDFVAKQHHRDELVKATSGIVAATKPSPRPTTPAGLDYDVAVEAAVRMQPAVLEQTRLIARTGMAARDLGHAIANNLRQLHTQEGTHQ